MTCIPDYYDGLDPYECGLMLHYDRQRGDGTTVTETTRETAERTKMSAASVSRARKRLIEKGLIAYDGHTVSVSQSVSIGNDPVSDRNTREEPVSTGNAAVSVRNDEPAAEERARVHTHEGGRGELKNQKTKTKDSVPETASGTVSAIADPPQIPLRQRPRNDWYDAIREVWNYTGALNGAMEKMLRGVSDDPKFRAGNVRLPGGRELAPAHVRCWAAWYRATALGGSDRLNMLEDRMKIASSIAYWVEMGCPPAPVPERAPSPFDGLVIIQ